MFNIALSTTHHLIKNQRRCLLRRPFSISPSSLPPLSDLIAKEITVKTQALTDTVLTPTNKLFLGPLPRDANQENSVANPSMPLVFLLGNHSSGKSTFVNYLHGRKIQTTGVAPTDDAFTIIAPGNRDSDQDGPALIGNPSSGFSGLRAFGPNLVNHVNLKVREDLAMSDIMLVDSPGMIDSPANGSNPWDFGTTNRDRGYDFQAVTRWFAERADVICLFFDPDKPGTTGETLATLTKSLAGLDHKLLIILNKVDQFERIHDFARSYGSLCWNLSKVIPRKDLPRIYTMCIPQNKQTGDDSNNSSNGMSSKSLVDILDDLELQREEVIDEVKKAPHRRVDNLITTLYDSTRMLRTHVVVAEAARAAHHSVVWKTRIQSSAILIVGQAASFGLISTGALFEFGIGLSALSVLATAVSAWDGQRVQEKSKNAVTSIDGLNNLFRETHVMNIAEGDEFLEALWERRVRTQLELALKTLGPENIPTLTSSDLQSLDDIVNKECSQLRKISNPL